MTEQTPTPLEDINDPSADDDTEGHKTSQVTDDDDDTQGHKKVRHG